MSVATTAEIDTYEREALQEWVADQRRAAWELHRAAQRSASRLLTALENATIPGSSADATERIAALAAALRSVNATLALVGGAAREYQHTVASVEPAQ